MNKTNSWGLGLANDQTAYHGELRELNRVAYCSATQHLPTTQMTRKHHLGRSEWRTPVHYMGAYADDAPLLAKHGADPILVLAPLGLIEQQVWFAADRRSNPRLNPCLESAQTLETERQGEADEAQIRLAASINLMTLANARRKLMAHKVAIRKLLAVIAFYEQMLQAAA